MWSPLRYFIALFLPGWLLAAPAPVSLSDYSAQELVKYLELQPLADEGGFFRQIYLSAHTVKNADLRPSPYPAGEHPLGTVIYFLMTPEAFSALHLLATDETLLFIAGDPVDTLLLYPDGSVREITIGPDLARGHYLNFTVPAGVWQGHSIRKQGRHGYAMFNAFMSPGFTWQDFKAGHESALRAAYPSAARRIHELVRPELAPGVR